MKSSDNGSGQRTKKPTHSEKVAFSGQLKQILLANRSWVLEFDDEKIVEKMGITEEEFKFMLKECGPPDTRPGSRGGKSAISAHRGSSGNNQGGW